MTDLQHLISRLKEGEGEDRELDAKLFILARELLDRPMRDLIANAQAMPFTASLDAAIAFAEKVLPGCWYHIAKGKLRAAEPLFGALILFGSDDVLGAGEHPTSLPRALLIATLRALQAQGGSDA